MLNTLLVQENNMSIASLLKFAVPSAEGVSQGMLMPKLGYRFRVEFIGFGVDQGDSLELTKQVVSFARPTVTFGDIDIHVYNSIVKLAGKPTWGDISVVLRDDAVGNVSRLVGQQIQKQFDFMEQSSASSGLDYKFTTRCEMLDGANGTEIRPLETWELYGCYIQVANYNEVKYDANDPVTISLTLKFDNAIQLSSVSPGVGQYIGPRQNGVIATG